MSKSEKIREYMQMAYAGGVYNAGNICRGRVYAYRLEDGLQAGAILRCPLTLLDTGCPVWETWATDTSVIRALSGRDIATDCASTALDSFFLPGGTLTPWDVYVDKYGAPFISNI